MKKHFLYLVWIFAAAVTAQANNVNFAYLYIQGDKQTPFYVKLEDAMQPRFGKNYCIIPKLAPGPARIEILFQQNIYPSRKFTVQIPEGGSRGFLLVKLDGGYALYDLQQDFYLPAGNALSDDHVPLVRQRILSAAPPEIPKSPSLKSPDSRSDREPPKTARKKKEPVEQSVRKKREPLTAQPRPASDGQPVFIDDLELTGGGRDTAGIVLRDGTENSLTIVNTDCPTPLSSEEFGKVFTSMSGHVTDEDRLEYMYGRMDLCYESWQARTLAGKLSGDAARFSLLRKIYPRITDQAAFPLLDDLLTSDIWKAEFNRLVHR